jgi:dipeptidyl aminopeptidase/acylaminoacyl peptidase
MKRAIEPKDLALYRMISEPSLSPDGRRVAFSVKNPNLEEDRYDSDVYVIDAEGGTPTKFTSGGRDSDPSWSPDGTSLLFLSKRGFGKQEKGGALYAIGASGGEAALLVKRKEGISSPRWSPDSKTVYFLSDVVKEEKDDVKVIRRLGFWFNGLGFTYNRRKHLFSIAATGGKPRQITKGDLDVGGFAVSHNGTRLAYLASTDDLHPFISDLFVTDLASGRKTKVTNSTMELTGVAWSPDDRKLALLGDDLPSGFASHERIWTADPAARRLSLIDRSDSNKANGLNSDVRAKDHGPHPLFWERDGIYHLEAAGGSVGIMRLKPDGSSQTVVGGDRSVEGFDVAGGRVAFVAMTSSELEELWVKHGEERQVTRFNDRVYGEVEILRPESFRFRASDGETVEGWVLLPKGTRRHPGVLYIHGGPKTAFGHSYMHEFQVFAGAGYAVIYMNPRGSDGYTEEFADIRGRYGSRDYDDLMEGLDHALKRFPRIDGERLAVAGGSYGGWMTNWAVGHTDRFRAAVSDRSISNWISFWGVSDIGPHFTSDQVGGDPWSSEDKVTANSPLKYAPKVQTPLLLVHSMEDYRCPVPEALQFFTALKSMGKVAELALFPGETHDLSRSGKPKHRVLRLNQYLRWFRTYLK